MQRLTPYRVTGFNDGMWNQLLEHGYYWINLAEGILWLGFAIGFGLSVYRPGLRTRKIIAAVTFLWFGFSDFAEMNLSGDLPWWLLLWKGSCLLVLLILLIDHAYRLRHRR
jgi:hypothetical protein